MASKRGYITIGELEEYTDITVTDEAEAYERISQAEEIIDQYVGFQHRFMEVALTGLAVAGSSTSITLARDRQGVYDNDYFVFCGVEIIGGSGKGQKRMCIASTKDGVLTVDEAWVTIPDQTSYYKIEQLGKFPTIKDFDFDSNNIPNTYYKFIPEAVKRAVVAQMEYMIEMGDSFFASDKVDKKSESIGDYSYSNSGGSSLDRIVAPKAKVLLRGIRNITGEIIAE